MRYVSDNVISFSIRVKGTESSARVNFTANTNGGSTFSTDRPALIHALESSPMYGTRYRRAPECECGCRKAAAPKKGDTDKRVRLVTGVCGWQDAVEYLTGKCGSDARKLKSPDAILAEAEAKGVKFPDLA